MISEFSTGGTAVLKIITKYFIIIFIIYIFPHPSGKEWILRSLTCSYISWPGLVMHCEYGNNIRTKDSHEIEAARHQLKDSQNEITALEEQLMNNNATNELFLFRLLESIRRICAYARDFGEVLLNIKLHDESYTSSQ